MALAAWSVVLGRYTRQEDLLIGTPTAGRTRPELEHVIGLFVNTLPVRVRPSPARQFSELMRDVHFTTLDILGNQDIPYVKIAEALATPRSTTAHRRNVQEALFQTTFSYSQYPDFGTSLPECTVVSVRELSTGAPRFTLSVEASVILRQFELRVEYDTQVFDQGTVKSLAHSYENLLAYVTANPDLAVASLPVRNGRHPLPGGCPDRLDRTLTLHRLFEDQARRTPAAAAIEHENGSTTSYSALNETANRLARHLLCLGVTPGGRVAIGLSRGSKWPAAILAVLKAGCAYVPIDPESPLPRIEHVLTATDPQLVLVEQDTSAVVESRFPVAVLDSEDLQSALQQHAADDLMQAVRGGDIAYIPFTSGSTGLPKGTLLSHSNLVSFTLAATSAYALTERDRILQIAAMTFDVHVEELFPAWTSGGTVVFSDRLLSRMMPADLLAELASRAASWCEIPTAYWIEMAGMAEDLTSQRPERLRLLLVGGERAPTSLYEKWRATGMPLTVVYGLTETAVTSTTHTPSSAPSKQALPIGRPMGHAAVYVLDDSLGPLGVGFPGEIYLGGPGISSGLLNLPGMTASKFLPDPFASLPGARMYRTGDLGRVLPDGDLEFLGRIDSQVKIRSFRVEPEEIEVEFERHPAVRQAVVIPNTLTDGEVKLYAYITGRGLNETSMLSYIRARMPAHLVPARVTILDQLPQTPHGKVDRPALDSFLPIHSEPTHVEADLTDLQDQIRTIYLRTLDIPTIDIAEDIFEKGGHSLSALRIIGAIQSKFNIRISVMAFFNNSSIAATERIIRSKLSEEEILEVLKTSG